MVKARFVTLCISVYMFVISLSHTLSVSHPFTVIHSHNGHYVVKSRVVTFCISIFLTFFSACLFLSLSLSLSPTHVVRDILCSKSQACYSLYLYISICTVSLFPFLLLHVSSDCRPLSLLSPLHGVMDICDKSKVSPSISILLFLSLSFAPFLSLLLSLSLFLSLPLLNTLLHSRCNGHMW